MKKEIVSILRKKFTNDLNEISRLNFELGKSVDFYSNFKDETENESAYVSGLVLLCKSMLKKAEQMQFEIDGKLPE